MVESMSKKPPLHTLLTPEEQELFKSSLKNIRKVTSNTHHHSPSAKPSPRREDKPRLEIHPGASQDFLEKLSPEDWLSAEDYIHFARTGIPRRTLMKLSRGLIPIDARIDLHRLTGDEMIATMDQFLDRCQGQGQRLILVVHGKGCRGPNSAPVLKNVLNGWLRQQPAVLAFCTAKSAHGAAGALYILLKSRK